MRIRAEATGESKVAQSSRSLQSSQSLMPRDAGIPRTTLEADGGKDVRKPGLLNPADPEKRPVFGSCLWLVPKS